MTSKKSIDYLDPNCKSESELTKFHMDLAASVQNVTEEIVIKIARSLKKETGINNLCLAGGVALNCVANGKLIKENILKNIWIQPASGDAGSSLGAAMVAWYDFKNMPRIPEVHSMKGSYLGCYFSNDEIKKYLLNLNANFEELNDDILFETIAMLLDKGKVIGWFNGPMEFGPRALEQDQLLEIHAKKICKVL